MMQENKRTLFVFLSATGILLFILIWNFRWFPTFKEGDHLSNVIKSDGKGYYSYLPDIFINKDFGRNKTKRFYEVETDEGKLVNKYTYGTSFLELPFFIAAAAVVKIFDLPGHGYSETFQIAITLSGLFYFLAGIYFLALIFRILYPENKISAYYLLIALIFGSFILYYAVLHPSFSHVYSFFLINLFLYFVLRWKENLSERFLILLSFTAGFIFITRPVNILVIFFIPFFFNSFSDFLVTVKKEFFNLRKSFLMVTGCALPLILQMYLWYYQTGHWFYWSYQGEGFYFNNPEIVNFLFSFRKGFFIYSPLMLLLFPAWIYLFRNNGWKFFISFLFFLTVTYVFSSWYNWFYADSFGMRPMVDLSGIFMIIMAPLFIRINGVRRNLVRIFSVICIFLNLVFSWQFYHGIIHHNTMDARKFGMIFLKTGKQYYDYFGGMKDSPLYAPDGLFTLVNKKETTDPGVGLDCAGKEFPLGWTVPVDHKWKKQKLLMVEVNFSHMTDEEKAGNSLLFVIHASRNDSAIFYYAVRAKEFPVEEPGKWIEDHLIFTFENSFMEGDTLGLYFWNREKESIHLHQPELKISTPL